MDVAVVVKKFEYVHGNGYLCGKRIFEILTLTNKQRFGPRTGHARPLPSFPHGALFPEQEQRKETETLGLRESAATLQKKLSHFSIFPFWTVVGHNSLGVTTSTTMILSSDPWLSPHP